MIDLEKLREKAWEAAHDPDLDLFDASVMLKDSALAIAQAIDHIAQLEKDAGRYRWLRDDTEWEPFESSWLIKQDIYGCPTLAMDVAIDTAMESKHG